MKTTQVATLFCCLFLIGSAEVVAGPMMGAMSADLGVRSSAIAYLPAAYGLAYGAFALIAGPLSDRWGRRRPLQAGLLGFALLSAALPSAPSLAVAIVLSALAGLCAGLIQPNALSLVADESPPEQIGRRLSHVFVGLMLAFVLTPVVAGWLSDTAGWRSAYYTLAAMAALAFLAVTRTFVQRMPSATSHAGFLATHARALRTPGVRRRLAVSYLWLGWVAGFGAVVAEVAARKLVLSSTDTGLIAGLFGLAVIAGNLASGRLQRALGEAALPLAALAAAAGLLGLALPVGSTTQLVLLGLPWAFGYGCAGPLHHARLSALSERYRGTINSYHASLLNLGIFSVSFLLGSVVPRFPVEVFCALAGGVTLVGACLLLPWPWRKAGVATT
ncbi:MFS transporter [Variovorax sp. Varisp41]|uniref:MFS transporter n=1 Tax=Variovorax sp. Varisp41 TaxID=3243033 RepID=UPI0039B5ED6C